MAAAGCTYQKVDVEEPPSFAESEKVDVISEGTEIEEV
jgi:hypothetical protein